MESLRNSIKRKLEIRGLNRLLLEEDAINHILSFAYEFPNHEETVDFLLDYVVFQNNTSNDRTSIIDMDSLQSSLTILRPEIDARSNEIRVLRNSIRRKIEIIGLNRLLEEDAMNEILLFTFDFPDSEDDAAELLLDVVYLDTPNDRTSIIDHMDSLQSAVSSLRALSRAKDDLHIQINYFDSEGSFDDASNFHSDYCIVEDADLELLIEQLSINEPNPREIPPASKTAIEALRCIEIKTTSDSSSSSSSWGCAVCMEDKIEAKDGAKEMPCKHVFHTHCIISWLVLHNSCPLCRYQLPM